MELQNWLPLSKLTIQRRGKTEITLLTSKYTFLSWIKEIIKPGGFAAMYDLFHDCTKLGSGKPIPGLPVL